jgi:hypothetical protein
VAKVVNRLSARGAGAVSKPGYHPDGGGLYLQVTSSGSKSWIYRYSLDGKTREMDLGSYSVVSLAEARDAAQACRRLRQDGIDPIDHRKSKRASDTMCKATDLTFDQCADAYIAAHRSGWRNPKHAEQWANTLRMYASPKIGSLPVQQIDTGLVMQVLDPIWRSKTETASRLRGRIESVLDWATVRGHRVGENPARWRGHLDHLLPQRAKVQTVVHHAALPYHELPSFMESLRAERGMAALGLQFQVLTAC